MYSILYAYLFRVPHAVDLIRGTSSAIGSRKKKGLLEFERGFMHRVDSTIEDQFLSTADKLIIKSLLEHVLI